MSKEPKKTSEEQRNSDKFYIYGRYFAKIPRYLNKALKIVHNYNDSINIIFPKFETPLFYLSVGCVVNEIYLDYNKIRHKNDKYKTFYLIDQTAWHALSSFIIPSISLSNMIHYFILFYQKLIKNRRILKVTCGSASGFLIYVVMTPIDLLSDFIMDNTFRKVVNYKSYDEERKKEPILI